MITSRIFSELFAFWSHATFRPVGIVLGIQTLFLTKIQQQPLRARIINDFFFQIFNNVTQNLVNFDPKLEKPFVTMRTVKNVRKIHEGIHTFKTVSFNFPSIFLTCNFFNF